MVGIHKQQPNDHATHIEHTDCCPDSVDVEQVRLIRHMMSVVDEESVDAQDWIVQG